MENSSVKVSSSFRLVRHLWLLAAVVAAVFILLANQSRVDRVEYLSGMESWSVGLPEVDADSLSGYENGQRRLIVPGHHNPSFAVIAQTQEALAKGQWRLREVDYENAPDGRATHATAPYRWYLTGLAWAFSVGFDEPLGKAVESASLFSDTILQLVMLLSLAYFAGRRFGLLAACLASFSVVAFFPLGGNFQAGAPDPHALAWVFVLWSVLPLLCGTRGGFVLGGVCAGLGLWVDASLLTPVLGGVLLGGLGQVLVAPGDVGERSRYWRIWGRCGAGACLLGYLVEYFPSHLDWSIQSVHGLHAVALLGAGELVFRVGSWRLKGREGLGLAGWASVVFSLAALAGLLVVSWKTGSGLWAGASPYLSELANHPAGTYAESVADWIGRDGLGLSVWAVLLPLAVLGCGLVAAWRWKGVWRAELVLCVGPVLVACGMAMAQLSWWTVFNVLLLPLCLLLFGGVWGRGVSLSRRSVAAACYVALLWPGVVLMTRVDTKLGRDLDRMELQTALERDLAYWLVMQAGEENPVVFTTPGVSEALQFYGGIRGIGSYDRENKAGLEAASRIASATTWDEASVLLSGRGAKLIVLASWDVSLESLIRMGRRVPDDAELPSDTLVGYIRDWNLAPWLRPIPYAVPKKSGFEDFSATVLTVQAEQEEADALCRLGDYFLELGMMPQAFWVRGELDAYPRSLAALAMQAQLSLALGDRAVFQEKLEAVLPLLSRRSARLLPFDRRVSLTILLLQAKRVEEAREQMEIVISELNEDRIRELTNSALVRVLAMSKMLKIDFSDTAHRELILERVPPEVRRKVR